ncbi:MAG TPA: hypothetical protein VMU54_00620 [Planctomycetota bacterium]|nr:hypothetical protein [Planctomycetota bacterium]
MMTWITLAAFVLAPAQEASSQDVRKKLDEIRLSVDLDATLDETVDALRRKLGVGVIVDPGSLLQADPTRRVALRLSDVRGSTVLYWAANLRGLDWDVQEGIVVLGRRESFRLDLDQRFFDLSGIYEPSPHAPLATLGIDRASGEFRLDQARSIGDKARSQAELREVLAGLIAPKSPETIRRALEKLSEGTSGTVDRALTSLIELAAPKDAQESLAAAIPNLGNATETMPLKPEQAWVDLLKENIAPGTWEGRKMLEVTPRGGIVATQSPAVLAEIEQFLAVLKSMSPAPIQVSAALIEDNDVLDAKAAYGRRAFMGAEERVALEGNARVLDRLRLTCFEGEESQATTSGPEVSYVIRVRAARDPGGESIRLRLEVQTGATLARKLGPAPTVDRSLVRFTTTVWIPNGGATLFRLPGHHALLVSAKTDAAGASKDAELGSPPDAGTAKLLEKLVAAPPVDLDFKEAALSQVVEFMRRATQLNFVIDPAAVETPEKEIITFQAKGIRPAAALSMILRPRWKTIVPDHEAFRIAAATAPGVIRFLVTSIRHLIEDDFTYEDFANLIKNTVDKDRWEEAEGKSILVTGSGLLLVRNDAEMIDKVKRFLLEIRRPEVVVTLEAEEVRLEPGKGRETLGTAGAGSLLTEEEARRLESAPGAVSERYTLRGPAGKELALHWEGARPYAVGGARGVSHVVSELKAKVSLSPGTAHASLQLNDQFFTSALEEERPRSAEARVQTSLLLPTDRVALLELPRADGKDLYLLVRVTTDSIR